MVRISTLVMTRPKVEVSQVPLTGKCNVGSLTSDAAGWVAYQTFIWTGCGGDGRDSEGTETATADGRRQEISAHFREQYFEVVETKCCRWN